MASNQNVLSKQINMWNGYVDFEEINKNLDPAP